MSPIFLAFPFPAVCEGDKARAPRPASNVLLVGSGKCRTLNEIEPFSLPLLRYHRSIASRICDDA